MAAAGMHRHAALQQHLEHHHASPRQFRPPAAGCEMSANSAATSHLLERYWLRTALPVLEQHWLHNALDHLTGKPHRLCRSAPVRPAGPAAGRALIAALKRTLHEGSDSPWSRISCGYLERRSRTELYPISYSGPSCTASLGARSWQQQPLEQTSACRMSRWIVSGGQPFWVEQAGSPYRKAASAAAPGAICTR